MTQHTCKQISEVKSHTIITVYQKSDCTLDYAIGQCEGGQWHYVRGIKCCPFCGTKLPLIPKEFLEFEHLSKKRIDGE